LIYHPTLPSFGLPSCSRREVLRHSTPGISAPRRERGTTPPKHSLKIDPKLPLKHTSVCGLRPGAGTQLKRDEGYRIALSVPPPAAPSSMARVSLPANVHF